MPTDFDAKKIDTAWARYEAAATKANKKFKTYFDPGAKPADFDAAEKALGGVLPPDLKALLTIHNGAPDYFTLPGWELFSTTRIVEEWKIWEELYRTQFKPEKQSCEPKGPIRGDEWWRLRWIPFCGNGGGDHLCVDMEPAEGGAVGQVITMWHDDPRRELIAPSLTAYVESIATDFEQGKLACSDDFGGVHKVTGNKG